jgi:hypothetical protein
MKLLEGVELKLEAGKLMLIAELAALILPKLAEIKAKVESGEIDLIKGMDLDKVAILKAIELIEAELVK